MKLVSLCFLAPTFVQSREYVWSAGFNQNLTDSFRHSWQIRSILETLVCGDNIQSCQFNKFDFYNALRNYGCNCLSREEPSILDPTEMWTHMSHNGPPLDEVDSACMKVHKAYQCMFMDADDKVLKQGQTYTVTGEAIDGCFEGMQFTYHTDSNNDIVCGPETNPNYANNQWNGCRQAACQIEREFAYSVIHHLQDPVLFKQDANANGLYFWSPVRKAKMCQGPAKGYRIIRKRCLRKNY